MSWVQMLILFETTGKAILQKQLLQPAAETEACFWGRASAQQEPLRELLGWFHLATWETELVVLKPSQEGQMKRAYNVPECETKRSLGMSTPELQKSGTPCKQMSWG